MADHVDAGSVRVRLGADFERHGFDQYDRAVEAAERQKKIEAKLGAEFDQHPFDEYERRLAATEARAKRRNAYKAALGADFDGRAFNSAEAAMRRHEREQEQLRRGTDRLDGAFSSLGRSVGNMIPGLNFSTRVPVYQLAALTAGATAAVPPVVALTGSLGPLAGWLAAIPGLAAAAGGGLLAATLGLRGVGDALGAAWDAQISAAEDGVAAAKKQEGAAEQVRSAERALEDALESRTDAQEEVNEATDEARRALRDMRLEAERANLTEEERVVALREAREELGRLDAEGAGQREIAKARRDIRDAELELAEAQNRRGDIGERLRESERGGIRQMPEVVRARERLADAERSVEDAQRGVRQANRDAAQSMSEASGGAAQLEQKLADLSPAGRAFVELVQGRFFPLFKRLRNEAQEGLLPGLGRGLVEAERNFPVLERMVGRYSDALGDAAEQQGRFFGSRAQGRDMEQIFGQGERLIRKSADAAIDWERGLTHVAVAAEPLLDWAGDMNVELADMFETWAEGGRETGRFERSFQRTIDATKDVIGAAWDFGHALINIGGIGARVWGNDLRGGIRDVADEFRDWTESVKGERSIEGYFERWRDRWSRIKDAIGDVIDEYRQLRREGRSATQALTKMLADQLGEAFVELSERLGRLAPKAAWGFVKGFLQADAWGKFAISLWLIGKFGGAKAFLAIGRTAGGWLAAAMAGRLMGYGVVGRFATWLVGPERMAKFGAAGQTAGAATGRRFGLGMAIGLALFLPDIIKMLRSLKDEASDVYKDLFGDKVGGAITDVRDFIGRNYRAGPGAPIVQAVFADSGKKEDKVRAPEVDLPSFARAERAYRNLFGTGSRHLRQLERESERQLKRISQTMGRETEEGQRAATRNFGQTARSIEQRVRDGEISTRQGMRSISRLVKTHSEGANSETRKNFDSMGQKINRRMKKAADDTGIHMQSLQGAVESGVGGAAGFLNQTLRDMGLKPIKFTAKGVTIGGKPVPKLVPIDQLGEGRAGGGFAGLFAGGGLIGRWGERGRDKVHAILGRGEAVLNHYQQKVVNAALRVSGMARGGLREVFGRTRGSKHYMAEGGIAGEPRGYAGGGEIVGVPGSPGEFAARSVLDEIAWVKKNFPGLVLTDAYGPGHQSPGHTTYGTAADFSGPDAAMDAAVRALVKQGYLVGYDGRFGSQDWPNHGPSTRTPNFHFHVEFGGAGQVRGGVAPIDIPNIEISGPDGPLRRLAQALVNRARRGARTRLDEALLTTGPGGSRHGGEVPDGSVRDWLTRALRITDSYSDPNLDLLYGRTMQESGGDPHAINLWDSNAAAGTPSKGLLQTIDPTFDAYSLPGMQNIWNPVHNAVAAIRYMLDRYGHIVGPGPGGYAGGGVVGGDGASISDYPFVGGFDGGGFVGGAGMMTGKGKRSTSKWKKTVGRIENEIEDLGNRYQLDNRWADLTEEEFIVEGDEDTPPRLDQEAIERRVGELDKLIATRRKIAMKYKRMADYIDRLVKVYDTMRKRLEASIDKVRKSLKRLKGRKGKEAGRQRKAQQERLDSYSGALQGAREQLGELRPRHKDALYEWESSRIDLQELRDEKAPLLGGGAGLELPEWEPSKDDDDTAQSEQDRQRLAMLEDFKRISQGAFSVFQGSGDIGAGAQYALRAAANPQGTPEGVGPGLGLEMRDDGRIYPAGGTTPVDPGSLTRGEGFAPQIHMTVNTLHPGDPATLAAIGRAATAGQSLQGAVPSNRRTVR